MLRALRDIFRVFATPPEAPPPRASDSGAAGEGGAWPEDDVGPDWAVSPAELRKALSGLGRAAVNFELNEMHDASEVRALDAVGRCCAVLRRCEAVVSCCVVACLPHGQARRADCGV